MTARATGKVPFFTCMRFASVVFLILALGAMAATEKQQIEAVQGLVSRVLGKVCVGGYASLLAIRGQVRIPTRRESRSSPRVLGDS